MDSPQDKPRHRHWLSISLRFALIALTLACLPLAYFTAVYLRPAQKRRTAILTLHNLGGNAYYHYDLVRSPEIDDTPELRGPEWLRRILGYDPWAQEPRTFSYRTALRRITDADLELLRPFQDIECIDLYWMVSFKKRRSYETEERVWSTSIGCDGITDAGLHEIAHLKKLRGLQASVPNVTDASCEWLSKMPALETLSLRESQITDVGLMKLTEIRTLKTLYVDETQVTAKGLNAFRAARPDVDLSPKGDPGRRIRPENREYFPGRRKGYEQRPLHLGRRFNLPHHQMSVAGEVTEKGRAEAWPAYVLDESRLDTCAAFIFSLVS